MPSSGKKFPRQSFGACKFFNCPSGFFREAGRTDTVDNHRAQSTVHSLEMILQICSSRKRAFPPAHNKFRGNALFVLTAILTAVHIYVPAPIFALAPSSAFTLNSSIVPSSSFSPILSLMPSLTPASALALAPADPPPLSLRLSPPVRCPDSGTSSRTGGCGPGGVPF